MSCGRTHTPQVVAELRDAASARGGTMGALPGGYTICVAPITGAFLLKKDKTIFFDDFYDLESIFPCGSIPAI